MYAVIQTGGKQYRVAQGDKLRVEKLAADEGATVELDTVLMVADEVSLVQAVERTLPDLVIADFSFPVCGGTNVVRLLKQRSPGIKIIILSADDDPVVVGEIVEAGAEGFVLKRRAVVDLISAIREVCRGRRYVSPVVED